MFILWKSVGYGLFKMDYPLPWIRLCVIIKNLIVLPWFIFINQTYICTLCMVEWCHPCPLCWVRSQAIMLRCHWWHLTKHNGQGWDNLNTLRFKVQWQTQYWFWKFMFNNNFGHCYECMIIMKRSCLVMWSRK
jgi:hypothetical protein